MQPSFSPAPEKAPLLTGSVFSFWVQNLTNEEQVVVIQARTVLTLAEKVTATVWILGRGLASCRPSWPFSGQRSCSIWEEGALGWWGPTKAHTGPIACTVRLCKGKFSQMLPLSALPHSLPKGWKLCTVCPPSLIDLPSLLLGLPNPPVHFLPTSPNLPGGLLTDLRLQGEGMLPANRSSNK